MVFLEKQQPIAKKTLVLRWNHMPREKPRVVMEGNGGVRMDVFSVWPSAFISEERGLSKSEPVAKIAKTGLVHSIIV